jgi:hypothetical protein
LQRIARAWIDVVLRHHVVVLVLGALLTAFMAHRASLLEIDSDLRSLMPRTHPVVTEVDEIEARFGYIGSLNIVVEGATPEARHAFADAIAQAFAGHPHLVSIDHRIDASFFEDRALYYLSDEDMARLRERIDAWQHYELCSAAPDVCVEKPDPEALDRLEAFMDEKRKVARDRIGFDEYYEDLDRAALVVFVHPDRP